MGKRRRHPHGRVGARGPPPAQPTRSPGGRGLLWTRSVTSWKGSRTARPGGGAGSPVSTLSQALEGTPDLGPCAMPPPVKRGHRGVPCRTAAVSAGGGPPGGPSPAAWTLVWDVVHSPACSCPSRLPVAAARPAAPRGVPTGDPGGGRRVCADLAAPTRRGWIWGAGGPVTGTSSQHVAGAEAEQVLAGDRRSAKVAWEPCARWPFQPPRVPPHGPAGSGGGSVASHKAGPLRAPGGPATSPPTRCRRPPRLRCPVGSRGSPLRSCFPFCLVTQMLFSCDLCDLEELVTPLLC